MKIIKTLTLSLMLAVIAGALEVNENLDVTGSLRYRHEYINQQDKDVRNRQRISAKTSLLIKINPHIISSVELGSGSFDHSSRNQTLDDGFAAKQINISQAYFTWTPGFVEGASLTGGKFANPFTKVSKLELQWDSDNAPEGLALSYDTKAGMASPFVKAGFFWIDEKSSGNDVFLEGGQAGTGLKITDALSLTVGGGFYLYGNVKNSDALTVDGEFWGNSMTTNGAGGDIYAEDYEIAEGFLEAKTNLADLPAAVFAHFVQNTAVSSENTGWAAGVSIGKAKKPGSWNARCYYRDVQKDAVFGGFGDSDFGGGGTGNSGIEANGSVVVAKGTSFSLTYFNNENASKKNYQRVQADAQFKF